MLRCSIVLPETGVAVGKLEKGQENAQEERSGDYEIDGERDGS